MTDVILSSTALASEVDKALSEMTSLLSSLDEQQINQVPFEGSWTAGQVGQHILLSIVNLPRMLHGPSEETTDRASDSKLGPIKRIFLDYSTKFTSPDFIKPKQKDYDKTELIAALDKTKHEIMEAANTLDLTKTSTVFELPGEGHLTVYEWISFATVHTTRHNHQLRHIVEVLKAP